MRCATSAALLSAADFSVETNVDTRFPDARTAGEANKTLCEGMRLSEQCGAGRLVDKR